MHRHLSVSSSLVGAVSTVPSAFLRSEKAEETADAVSPELPSDPFVETPRVPFVLPSPVVAGARRAEPRGLPRPNRGLPPPHADLSGSRRRSGGDRGRR